MHGRNWMALYLSNEDVQRLITTSECVDVLDDLFRQEARGLVENLPRKRKRMGRASSTLMGGTVLGSQAYGVRHSSLTLLYNTESGELEAALQPSALAWIRTGAATGVATKYMAPSEASVVGLIGAGRQATTQLEGIVAARPIKRVKVFCRTPETRERFATEMEERLDIEVVPVATAEECVGGSHIVVTITNSRDPVFDGTLLEPGTHINAAGANSWTRRELDYATIERADLIVVDDLEQAKTECGELVWAAERGSFRWQRAVELHDIVSGKVSGRPSDDAITLFESQGIGIEDVAASAYVLNKARLQGVGQDLPF
jgi:ornithine cyclodeaminase/alanine dehydrogenase-like protein (mu-crystallin family)